MAGVDWVHQQVGLCPCPHPSPSHPTPQLNPTQPLQPSVPSPTTLTWCRTWDNSSWEHVDALWDSVTKRNVEYHALDFTAVTWRRS